MRQTCELRKIRNSRVENISYRNHLIGELFTFYEKIYRGNQTRTAKLTVRENLLNKFFHKNKQKSDKFNAENGAHMDDLLEYEVEQALL